MKIYQNLSKFIKITTLCFSCIAIPAFSMQTEIPAQLTLISLTGPGFAQKAHQVFNKLFNEQSIGSRYAIVAVSFNTPMAIPYHQTNPMEPNPPAGELTKELELLMPIEWLADKTEGDSFSKTIYSLDMYQTQKMLTYPMTIRFTVTAKDRGQLFQNYFWKLAIK